MPATFTAVRGAFTPSTSTDNYTVVVNSGVPLCRVMRIGWGGRLTQPAQYRTRWTQPTVAGSGPSGGLVGQLSNPAVGNTTAIYSTWSTPPTLPADPGNNYFAVDWNAQGGEGVLNLPSGKEWVLWQSGGGTSLFGWLSCRNVQGTDANGSHYLITLQE